MTHFVPDSSKGEIYQAICQLLSGGHDETAWEKFTQREWNELVRIAGDEGVAPLLHRRLADQKDQATLPQRFESQFRDLRKRLAADYYKSSAQNQLLFAELGRILQALNGAGTDSILLKGAALGVFLYPDLALRPMNDLDLLVDRRSLDAAAEAIRSLGYLVEFPEHLGMAGWIDEAINHHIHLRGGSNQKLVVELHWSLVAGDADWRSPSLEWFWRESSKVGLPIQVSTDSSGQGAHPPSRQTRILSPTATLLYQAAHLILQHGEYRSILLWFYDLHLLVEKCQREIRWEELPEIARELHWADATHTALMAIRGMFRSSVPEMVIDQLEAYSEPRARRIIALNARAPDQRTKDTWQGLQVYDWPTRMRLIFALIFPRPAYLRWRYNPNPAWLWPVYYLYRWLDLSKDGLASLFRKKRGQPG